MWRLFLIIGLLVVAATLIPIARHQAWWVRIFDFPRLQIVVLGILAMALYFAFVGVNSYLDFTFVAAIAACLAYQAYMIFPYTRLARPQTEQSIDPDPRSSISILFANVQQDNREAEKARSLIRSVGADMVLLVETDEWWLKAVEGDLENYPFRVLLPQKNTYGMLLFSKLELLETEVCFLVQDDIPSIRGKVRLRSGGIVEFRCLHPRPPVPTEYDTAGPRDAEIIIVGRENRQDDVPFIVFGDLNDVAWSRTNYLFQNISGLLDPRVGRGFYHTFHARIPFLRFPLDHLFHSNHFRLVDFRRMEYIGSDHFPVLVTLSLEDGARDSQEEPSAEPEELAEAAEKASYSEDGPRGETVLTSSF